MNTINFKINKIVRKITTLLPILAILLTGCGGGGGGSTPEPQSMSGRFIDTRVEGINYTSDSMSGTTNASGEFSYTDGDEVAFSVGNITLGSTLGSNVVTPVDLSLNGNTDNPLVQNIARFLLMLDSDGDNSNGISISDTVQSIAQQWQQVDFSTSDLSSALINILSDVASADSRTPILPDAVAAKSHLEESLSCLASGVYAGTFSGDDNGRYLLWIQSQRFDPVTFGDTTPRTGVTSALVFSTDDNLVSGVAPRQGLSFNTEKGFISGVVSTGALFNGELLDYNTISNGVWQNSAFGESGTFAGNRTAGSLSAIHRISAFFNLSPAGTLFSADGSGLIALDVFADNTVGGVSITLRGDEQAVTGTLANGVISVSNGNSSFTLNFDADGSDPTNDLLLGTSPGVEGSGMLNSAAIDVIGSSCRLN